MAAAKNRRRVGIGLLGSGVVGEAIQDILFHGLKGQLSADIELELRKIYTRNPREKKWFKKHPKLFTAKPEEVIDAAGVDIVIEALGFQHPSQLPQFRDFFLRAFRNGKSVVTSDKAVLARYGKEIWASAKKTGQQIRFEACVGGGIPVIRSLSESFAVEQPEAVFGIVNGTCNYILSQMEKSGKPYAEALAEAQQKGYAETNPASDVNGSDAEAKLLLLSAVASVSKSSRARSGVRASKRFRRSTFATLNGSAQARSSSSRWRGAVVPWSRFSWRRLWCRGRTFLPGSMAPRTRSALRAEAAAPAAAAGTAIMFWSDRAPAADQPPWPCSATSASWRAANASSVAYRVSLLREN
jgi:homoserine dehydrogenase